MAGIVRRYPWRAVAGTIALVALCARGDLVMRAAGQQPDEITIARAIYDDDSQFNQLSSAGQMRLERMFGPRGIPAGKLPPPSVENFRSPLKTGFLSSPACTTSACATPNSS